MKVFTTFQILVLLCVVWLPGDALQAQPLNIPPRPADAPSGSEFMNSITDLSFTDREEAILQEFQSGNIPGFMRTLTEITQQFTDADGIVRQVTFRVMPIYLAVGSDSNYCRVPMGPITAQKIANAYGAAMPTRKLVNSIYEHAEVKLAPVTYTPVGDQNTWVEKFIEHNTDIEALFDAAGGLPGQLVGGTKKDVVLSNKITDPSRPNHVVIYGWHQLNGIQPLTNIHVNYYVDYSHGIRLLDEEIVVDGDSTTIQSVLQDDVLYRLLSDEAGPMPVTSYIYNSEKPAKFGVTSDAPGQIRVVVEPDTSMDAYYLSLSDDGTHFDEPITFTTDEHIVDGLAQDLPVFVKIKSENELGISPFSEVLAAHPGTTDRERMLVVNGFDRASDGNSYNFIRQHGNAIAASGATFASATNEAITAELFSLTDYPVVDYILGEESTVDETFSTTEQSLVADYLEAGGRLFVSGAEIAWDLDYRGTTSDRAFIRDYLKARYAADAPGGVANRHYTAEGVPGELFTDFPEIHFDNGSHGTYNVDYADVLDPQSGAEVVVRYSNVSNFDIAGIQYEGYFGDSTTPGKLIYLGFPFETIYPDSTRDGMMEQMLDFLYAPATDVVADGASIPDQFSLSQNYPNPFNPTTTIEYTLPVAAVFQFYVLNTLGHTIIMKEQQQDAGHHQLQIDASTLPSGVYFYRLTATDNAGNRYNETRKMILIK